MPSKRNAQQVIDDLWGGLALAAPAVTFVDPNQLPSAFHTLLVHQTGMTATLARHWRESICVEVLSDDMSLEQRALFRFVVLRTESTMHPVEIALIRIPLETFPPLLRRRFIEAQKPFGTLLTEAGIRFEARPQAYFTCVADSVLAERSGLREGTRLYGRINQLFRDDGALLCETAEALPVDAELSSASGPGRPIAKDT